MFEGVRVGHGAIKENEKNNKSKIRNKNMIQRSLKVRLFFLTINCFFPIYWSWQGEIPIIIVNTNSKCKIQTCSIFLLYNITVFWQHIFSWHQLIRNRERGSALKYDAFRVGSLFNVGALCTHFSVCIRKSVLIWVGPTSRRSSRKATQLMSGLEVL